MGFCSALNHFTWDTLNNTCLLWKQNGPQTFCCDCESQLAFSSANTSVNHAPSTMIAFKRTQYELYHYVWEHAVLCAVETTEIDLGYFILFRLFFSSFFFVARSMSLERNILFVFLCIFCFWSNIFYLNMHALIMLLPPQPNENKLLNVTDIFQ